MGLAQVRKGGTDVGRGNGLTLQVTETSRPPLQLLAWIGHKPRPIRDLPEEGLDIGRERPNGALRQPQ